MERIIKISILLIFITLDGASLAQQWLAPQPVMTKNILKSFIERQLCYPQQALLNKEEGTVIIGFSTDAKGEVTAHHILQSVSPAVDSGALRLFDLIVWRPAEKYGKAVACPAEENNGFPIKYNIKKYKKLVRKRGYDRLPQPFSPIDDSRKIYSKTQVDQLPTIILDTNFKTVHEYIYSQITYPQEAARFNISGTVRLSMIVETSGLLSNIVIMEAVGGGCSEEAVAVLQELKWVPGIKAGKAVRTKCEISIKFENPAQLKDKHILNQQNTGM
jgi:TonB family protein